MEDAGLVRLCQDGDTTAFEQLFQIYRDRVYGIAYKMVNNQEDALDLTQEIFLKTYQKIGKFDFKSAFSTWLYRLATNVCIDELRKHKSGREYPTDDSFQQILINEDTPEDEAISNEQEGLIWEAINSLREKERTVIILRDMEGLSYDEIAVILKCSLGRVKSRIHEARNKLKSVLQAKAELNVR
jgi:RNA polymerase sigma-70 factor (ECF subfamily)